MHDAQELTEHLQLSCAMIRRHRSRMIPGGIGYSDNPTFGGFGPKSPCNESAMEMGDMEAAFVGNLARYCIARGSIPAIPLKGFWWVNGVCRGVGGSGMDEDEIGFFSVSVFIIFFKLLPLRLEFGRRFHITDIPRFHRNSIILGEW